MAINVSSAHSHFMLIQSIRKELSDSNESKALRMRELAAERQSMQKSDGRQESFEIKARTTRDILSLSSGQTSTTNNQQQTLDTYSPNIGERDSSDSSSTRGMRISNGAPQADLSNAGTSNAISSYSSSARISSIAPIDFEAPAEVARPPQQVVASRLAEANHGRQSTLSLLA